MSVSHLFHLSAYDICSLNGWRGWQGWGMENVAGRVSDGESRGPEGGVVTDSPAPLLSLAWGVCRYFLQHTSTTPLLLFQIDQPRWPPLNIPMLKKKHNLVLARGCFYIVQLFYRISEGIPVTLYNEMNRNAELERSGFKVPLWFIIAKSFAKKPNKRNKQCH